MLPLLKKIKYIVSTVGGIYWIWGYFDVAKKTNQYNNELYKNIFGEYPKWKVSILPQYQGATLTMSYSLD